MRRVDLTGQRFGTLTAIQMAGSNRGRVTWLCRCDCGAEKVVLGKNLKSGQTKSCGYYSCQFPNGHPNRKHGGAGTRLYRIWKDMVRRCQNPKATGYQYYGGRGITVCDEWQSFDSFRDWAIGSNYSDNLEIDRKNPDGHYCPENCRWASRSQQISNRRRHNSSGFRGVCFLKSGRWKAEIMSNQRNRHIGVFDTKEQAAAAYDAEAIKAFGDFAVLNFPEGHTT